VTSGVASIFGNGLFSPDPRLFNKRPQVGYRFFVVSDVCEFHPGFRAERGRRPEVNASSK
jgi:hypothetical protein